LAEFRDRLSVAVADALAEQAAGTLLPEQEPYLKVWQHRLAALAGSAKARETTAKYLTAKTGLVERAKQRTTSLTRQQEVARLNSSWRFFDRVQWLVVAGSQSVEQLALLMRDAASVQQHRELLTISMSDQIPVWLKPQADRVLQSRAVFQAASQDKKRRTSRQPLAAGTPQTGTKDTRQAPLVRAAGNPASGRWRVSFVARQAITGWLSDAAEPAGAAHSYSKSNLERSLLLPVFPLLLLFVPHVYTPACSSCMYTVIDMQ
jgi:hypothetical protein